VTEVESSIWWKKTQFGGTNLEPTNLAFLCGMPYVFLAKSRGGEIATLKMVMHNT
jgi:hypothetical protein